MEKPEPIKRDKHGRLMLVLLIVNRTPAAVSRENCRCLVKWLVNLEGEAYYGKTLSA
jgi:hypothetical protein